MGGQPHATLVSALEQVPQHPVQKMGATAYPRQVPNRASKAEAGQPASRPCRCAGRARAWRGVWQKRCTSRRTGARQNLGRLSQMFVAATPGDTDAEVNGRPAARARRCSSAAVSTLHSLERA